jgi:RNAse (barnase) inhibitor barstar
MLSDKNFAFFLQNSLMRDSVNNLIFFIPNQKSLDRLFLKKDYDLKEKLMSPHEISGGNKGSIACYLDKNKKDLPNDLKLNFDDLHYKIADHKYDWQKNARIEFRLASADLEYNLQLHIVFIMLVMLESLILYDENKKYNQIKTKYKVPRKFYDSEMDNIITRYEDGLFLDKKTHLFSKKLQEKGFSQLIKLLNQVKSELENLIKCIKN